MHPAHQQQILLSIAAGQSVTRDELTWAVELGYVVIHPDNSVEVTEKGVQLLNHLA